MKGKEDNTDDRKRRVRTGVPDYVNIPIQTKATTRHKRYTITFSVLHYVCFMYCSSVIAMANVWLRAQTIAVQDSHYIVCDIQLDTLHILCTVPLS